MKVEFTVNGNTVIVDGPNKESVNAIVSAILLNAGESTPARKAKAEKTEVATSGKRRGRPPGSKNSKKEEKAEAKKEEKKKRGRPKKAVAVVEEDDEDDDSDDDDDD